MKYLKTRLLIMFIAFAVLGIIMLVGSIRDKIELSKPRGNLETMTAADFYNGRFVEGDIIEIWDEYAYMRETDTFFGITYNTKVTSHSYSMPLPSSFESSSPKFISLSIRDGELKKTADKIVSETNNYLINDVVLDDWTSIHIEGKVTKLSGDNLKLFREYFQEIGGDESNIVAYEVHVGNDGSNSTTGLIVSIVLTLIGLGGLGFIIARKILSGSY
ncbi:MAG: hypothetical protein K2N38_14210 [Oscillospiraceae bacterium]|nr:hypothetical protein [Oscillospiraceae bacterium]